MISATAMERGLPIGAEFINDDTVGVRVWAPKRKRVEVGIAPRPGADGAIHYCELAREDDGYFSGVISDVRAGRQYGFRLDGGDRLHYDPASRFQPTGSAGLSAFVDPRGFRWSDADWPGITPAGQVLYEMHIGTFTPEGTWAAAAEQLAELAAFGVTALEVMPVAEFPGRWGWGYDGVCLYAPSHLYGTPDDMRRFVDRAHAAGIGVVLDVVFNHFGNVDNYLSEFSCYWIIRESSLRATVRRDCLPSTLKMR